MISVTIQNIQMEQTQDQPLFFSMALFDINSKKKVSENFYFDNLGLNLAASKKLSQSLPPRIDQETRSLQCWVELPSRNESLYLVFIAERVFHGDPAFANEIYHRTDKSKKGLAQLEEIITESCSRSGSHRQPFFWTVVPLFHSQTGVLPKKSKRKITIDDLYLTPWFKDISELCDRVYDLREGKMKKSKKVKGQISCKLLIVNETHDVPNRLDSSLALIQVAFFSPSKDITSNN